MRSELSIAGFPHSRPLPADFWQAIFGNNQPVAVEIGPGRGEFLVTTAAANQQGNFFAVERSHSRTRMVQHKLQAAGISNARVIAGDAPCIVINLLPDACVATYYVQFPDPWWKRRHHRRRLWTAQFVTALRRTLVAGGTIELITDVPDYFALAERYLNADPGLEPVTAAHTTPATPTSFARKARIRGAPIFLSIHRRKPCQD